MARDGERIRVGNRYVDADGHLWRVTSVTSDTATTLEGRSAETTCPVANGRPISNRDLARVELDSEWAELGLDTLGRLPIPGDLASFPAERKLLQVVAVEPGTLTLRVVQAAPEDDADVGRLLDTTLRDYLEAWGEGTFSAAGREDDML